MANNHDIVTFTLDGKKVLGIVIEHYSNPLDDFYVVYAEYGIYKFNNSNEDASLVLDDVIIPACDEALFEYRLKAQHLKDMRMMNREMKNLMDAVKPDVDDIFGEE